MARVIYDTGAKPDLIVKTPLARNIIRYKDYVWGWSFRFALGCFLIEAAGFGALLVMYHELVQPISTSSGALISFLFGSAGYGMGLVWALTTRALLFTEMLQMVSEETQFQKDEVGPPIETAVNPVIFGLNNGRGTVTISQPRKGAFRGWLADTLENDKILWSLRQAKERGWSEEQYQNLIVNLKRVGLLHSDDLYNGAPTMTQYGKELAAKWLK